MMSGAVAPRRALTTSLIFVLGAISIFLLLHLIPLDGNAPETTGGRARLRRLYADERWFRATVGPCKHAYFDLGANRGDIVSSMANVAREDMAAQGMRFNYTTTSWSAGHFDEHTEMENIFSTWMQKLSVKREDLCIVGIEGNPVFDERLSRLQEVFREEVTPAVDLVTESVVSNENGKTTLYLDTINFEKDFWGSSLANDNVDTLCGEGAREKFGTEWKKEFERQYERVENVECDKAKAAVDAVKLSTLMNTYIDPEAARRGESLLLIKMDIEGAEFPVFDEIVRSGAACAFTNMGNHLVIIYEEHGIVLGSGFLEYRGATYQSNLSFLRKCNVYLYEGNVLASV